MALESALGWHWLVDLMRCDCLPSEPEVLESILVAAAELAGATVVQSCFHRFSPWGLSGVVVIAESHLAAHTWPEHKAMCIDLFSCSQKIEAQIAIDFIAKKVGAAEVRTRMEPRGRGLSSP
ncbi:MAG: adenosylmethionine decarboxylase [Pirellula sp.]|nr:adenosylmethionine decarboxylase [Pirellula sp.]